MRSETTNDESETETETDETTTHEAEAEYGRPGEEPEDAEAGADPHLSNGGGR